METLTLKNIYIYIFYKRFRNPALVHGALQAVLRSLL